MSWAKWSVPFVLSLCILPAALAQNAIDDAQKKLLAKRAAEADAYRKLAEAIKGVQINSETYVRDFVAEHDEIRAGLDTFIRGVRLGQPRYYADGSAEVPAEVTVARLVEVLTELHTRVYKDGCGKCRVKVKDIQTIEQRLEKKVIQVVGMGAPREDLPPDLPEGVAEQLGGPPAPPEAPIPDIWRTMPAQARLMAVRAARVDAQRKLVERIIGLRVTSDTTVRDFVAEHDTINTVAAGTLVGFSEKQIYYHHDEPIVEVTLEVPVESVITTIKELHQRTIQGDRVKGSDIQQLCQSIKTQVFEATGTGVPPQRLLQVYNQKLSAEQRLPAWAMAPITVRGQGVPPEDKVGTPQGKLLAARAAEMDAKRKLAEHVFGLQLHSSTTVRDFVTEHDEIRSSVNAVLVGAAVERTTFKEDGTAEVVVSLPGLQVWEVLSRRLHNHPVANGG